MTPDRKKILFIAYFNTPELTEAAVRSFRKQDFDGCIVIFDNSDKHPWTAKMDGVEVIDNTKGQLIDFNAELERHPRRDKLSGDWQGCGFGSVKHMMTVEWMLQHSEEPFLLADSDILLKANIYEMIDPAYTAVGTVDAGWNNPRGIQRLLPFLCYINAPKCRKLGLHYYDPNRAWALDKKSDSRWYDTGASFLEDLLKCKQASLKQIDINQKMLHLGSGSWMNKLTYKDWLMANLQLWRTSPRQKGIKDVAICCIARQEQDYLPEFVSHHLALGVAKIYVYDNGQGQEPVPQFADDRVEVIDWRDKKNGQCAAYDHCYKRHAYDFGWIGFIDVDEHVHIKQMGVTLPEYLDRVGSRADVVLLNWRLMTDAGLTHYDPRPMQERFKKPMRLSLPVKFEWPENNHVKAFVRGGISGLRFAGTPHCPTHPTSLVAVNGDGRRCELKFAVTMTHQTAWLDHYYTKTAEEFMQKLRRGFPLSDNYADEYRRQALKYFFRINERTKEKEELLRDILLTNPNAEKTMEHAIKTLTGRQYRLTAEKGYLLRSKVSGKTFQEIDTQDMKRWEVIADPKAEQPAAESKPQTKKRGSKKEK